MFDFPFSFLKNSSENIKKDDSQYLGTKLLRYCFIIKYKSNKKFVRKKKFRKMPF